MKNADLIDALARRRRSLEVAARLDGRLLPIEGVAYANQDPEVTSPDMLVIALDRGIWQLAARYDPQMDDEMLPAVVHTLRELWDIHRASDRRDSPPDFYTWAGELLRTLYTGAYLTIPLPADVDPDKECECGHTPAPHRPRAHKNCLYTRETQ
jgi:hypothetical protein